MYAHDWMHTLSLFLSLIFLHSVLSQEDNGVKLIDPMGEMVTPVWEGHATRLANAEQEALCTVLKDIIEKEGIDMNEAASVITGRDTRYLLVVVGVVVVGSCI